MNKTDLRIALRNRLLTVCDQVSETFIHPLAASELNRNFPYIVLVYQTLLFDNGTQRGKQSLSIIGFVNDGDDNNLMELRDELEQKIFAALYRKDLPKVTVISIDNSNLFKPFGLDAGIYPPYAGMRFEIEIPEIQLL